MAVVVSHRVGDDGRVPLIDGANEPAIRLSIQARCQREDVVLHVAGMMPDHGQVAVSVPPSVALSALFGRLRGASAHAANVSNASRPGHCAWQAGYGIFSFTATNLPDVIAYVENQRERCAARGSWPRFDPIDAP